MPSQINSEQVYFYYDGQEICYTNDKEVAEQQGGKILMEGGKDEVPRILGYFKDIARAAAGDLEMNY